MGKRILIGLMLVGFALIWIHLSWSANTRTMESGVPQKPCPVSAKVQ